MGTQTKVGLGCWALAIGIPVLAFAIWFALDPIVHAMGCVGPAVRCEHPKLLVGIIKIMAGILGVFTVFGPFIYVILLLATLALTTLSLVRRIIPRGRS
jgi:hypothetical protein